LCARKDLQINSKLLKQYGFGYENVWIIDTGATCHVTNRHEHLQYSVPFTSKAMGIGGFAEINGIDNVTLNLTTGQPQILESSKSIKWTGSDTIKLN
jgi:hypothetical protein